MSKEIHNNNNTTKYQKYRNYCSSIKAIIVKHVAALKILSQWFTNLQKKTHIFLY